MLEIIANTIIIIMAVLAVLSVLAVVVYAIMVRKQFEPGDNPYQRICRQCGAHQHMYQSTIQGSRATWWEEVYPIGNDPNCKCHQYADFRDLL